VLQSNVTTPALYIVTMITRHTITPACLSQIHKSQGLSIDYLSVNLSNTWDDGMAYVALSRATSIEGLHISDYKPNCAKRNALVHE
jgi:ATP-dependent exoDNAse (exonuclease V) alpha subunit